MNMKNDPRAATIVLMRLVGAGFIAMGLAVLVTLDYNASHGNLNQALGVGVAYLGAVAAVLAALLGHRQQSMRP